MKTKEELVEYINNTIEPYIGTKCVNAVPMTLNHYHTVRGLEPVEQEQEGYLVVYEDSSPNTDFASGYVSWSPAKEFESAYVPTLAEMDYSHALYFARQGRRIARAGWNGKGMFAFVVKGDAVKQAIWDSYGEEGKEPAGVNDFMLLRGVDGRLSMWVPSSTDQLANDWTVR